MTYNLDGIKTAMVRQHEHQGSLVACPCGWTMHNGGGYPPIDLHALRFHYTHCPKAHTETTSE